MSACGLVIGTTGNVSARVAAGMRITPSRHEYSRLRGRDLVTVTADGSVVLGHHQPLSETPLHLEVYRCRPDVGGVVHTQSPCATAWGLTGQPLEPGLEDQHYYGIGAVSCLQGDDCDATAPLPGLGDALASSNAVLLEHHGVLAVGSDPAAALIVARVVEHMAFAALGAVACLGRAHAETV